MENVDGLNAGYARLLLDQYLENPEAVPEEWRELFEQGDSDARRQPARPRASASSCCARTARPAPPRRRRGGAGAGTSRGADRAAPAAADETQLAAVAAATALVKRLPDAGPSRRPARPARRGACRRPGARPEPDRAAPDAGAAARIPASVLRVHVPGETLADALPRPAGDLLRDDRVRDRAHLEPRGAGLAPPRRSSPAATGSRSRRTSSARCSSGSAEVEGLEQYLRRTFLGQKQFSIEGLDVLVPMLDEADRARGRGGRARGRDRHGAPRPAERARARRSASPYESILREFEGERTVEAIVQTDGGRKRRRQVPPRRGGHSPDRRRRDHRHPVLEPEPPRGRRPGRRGPHARRADRPQLRRRARTTRRSRCRS